MKPLILVVDDDPHILKYIRMILEFNECQIITAENGIEGLKVLTQQKKNPDLIISDIMMPKMDGYEFFKEISDNPNFCHIPFIFLSILDSSEDIRLGKILGADDYLTKPINESDFSAIVAGKIKRSKQIQLINKKINDDLLSIGISKDNLSNDNLNDDYKDYLIMVEVNWDDRVGPKLVSYYPKGINLDFSLDNVSFQLYEAISAMYGQDKILNAEGLLLNLKNFKIMAYVYFDSYPDESYRGGRKDYMLSIIAPKITYIQSLKLKKVFMNISSMYKEKGKLNIKAFWNQILDIFKSPTVKIKTG